MEPPSYVLANILLNFFNPIDTSIVLAILVLIVLLLCSALISGSEVAYFSLNPTDRESLVEDKSIKGIRVLKLLINPQRLLATILIANNFINVAIILLSTIIVGSDHQVGILNIAELTKVWVFLPGFIQVVCVTFLILLIGEVVPKVYATHNNVVLAKFMSKTMFVLAVIFKPLSYVLLRSTSFIDKRLKSKTEEFTIEDLSKAVDLIKGEHSSEEVHKILQGLPKFGNTDVKQIMTARMDVKAFQLSMSFEEVIAEIVELGYSRIPAYDSSIDEIKGILYIKDLLPHLKETTFEWQNLLRAAYIVPENKMADDLLKEFQEKKIHLAVVVDEYGGVSGIVTLEDVIEEIVGEITDEFDEDELQFTKIDDSNYVFQGKTALIDLYKIFHIDGDVFEENKGESDSLAGFIIEQAGRIPVKGESIEFDNYLFKIEAADPRKIKQVKVTILNNKLSENVED